MAAWAHTVDAAHVLTLPPPVSALVAEQDGVVSRRQLLGIGSTESDLRCWLRRGLLVAVHPGVYVDHTGEPTWCQRAWAAVLYAAPAALTRSPAILVSLGSSRQLDSGAPIEVEVEHGRTLEAPSGVLIRQARHSAGRVQWHRRPPRVRLEEAALDVAGDAADDLAAFAVLAEVVTARLTTPGRLAEGMARRKRQRRRRLLAAVLDDLEQGACSVLERAYLRDVERAHGLPSASRQVRASARGRIFRDVLYRSFGVVVELDGRADHTRLRDRDRDLDRDLDAVLDGLVTARLGHGQVLGRACTTAVRIGRLLQQHGWTGTPHPCPRCA